MVNYAAAYSNLQKPHDLQLTEKKNNKTKSGKRRRRFLHDGALALASKASSGYCTVPLPHRRRLSPVLTSVQE